MVYILFFSRKREMADYHNGSYKRPPVWLLAYHVKLHFAINGRVRLFTRIVAPAQFSLRNFLFYNEIESSPRSSF